MVRMWRQVASLQAWAKKATKARSGSRCFLFWTGKSNTCTTSSTARKRSRRDWSTSAMGRCTLWTRAISEGDQSCFVDRRVLPGVTSEVIYKYASGGITLKHCVKPCAPTHGLWFCVLSQTLARCVQPEVQSDLTKQHRNMYSSCWERRQLGKSVKLCRPDERHRKSPSPNPNMKWVVVCDTAPANYHCALWRGWWTYLQSEAAWIVHYRWRAAKSINCVYPKILPLSDYEESNLSLTSYLSTCSSRSLVSTQSCALTWVVGNGISG